MTVTQTKRWHAEVEIIKELGKMPSSRQMQKLLKERYGIDANHNTINVDLKQDLESLTKEEYTNQKDGILKVLDTEIDIAHNIATTESDNALKLKAMNTVSKLSRVKSDILIKFRRAQAKISKDEKAVYSVFIGEPKQINIDKYKKIKGIAENETSEN